MCKESFVRSISRLQCAHVLLHVPSHCHGELRSNRNFLPKRLGKMHGPLDHHANTRCFNRALYLWIRHISRRLSVDLLDSSNCKHNLCSHQTFTDFFFFFFFLFSFGNRLMGSSLSYTCSEHQKRCALEKRVNTVALSGRLNTSPSDALIERPSVYMNLCSLCSW